MLWCLCEQSIAPNYVWQSSQGMKVPLNFYLFDSGVWEFDVPWVINWWELWWPRGAHDSEDWDTPDLSPVPLWKVPVAKNPRVVRTWTCDGIGFDRRVSHRTVLGNLNRDVSHSFVSARIFTWSRNTRSLPRAWCAKASKTSKSAAGYASHWPCYGQSQINLQLVHNLSQTE